MTEAVFSVSFAGPLVTLQDAGRPGDMRYGVAASGPMDRLAFDAAHAALGNAPGLTAIEISLGGLVLQCTDGAVTVAIAGGDFVVQHGAGKAASWTILTIRKGERLSISAGKAGSWAYLAFAGDIVAEDWLGSQATHSTSGFGGGFVRTGEQIRVSNAAIRDDRLGEIMQPEFTTQGPIRAVAGPQDQHFLQEAVERFVSGSFTVTDAYDRMGMRLSGPMLDLDGALSIPSEPIVRGAIQVSGDGIPTVLMADHQTTGGYPKIATVISCDTDRLAQFRAEQSVKFASISGAQAVEAVRDYMRQKVKYLEQISVPRGSLADRLMCEDLNRGCVFEET